MQQRWTIKNLVEWTTRFFTEKGIEEPRLNAEVLLAMVLKQNRVYLYTHYDAPVNQNERELYRDLIKRRAKQEPLAHLLGTREFMSLDFEVSPAVLIPRPETELLVETVLRSVDHHAPLSICDVGTGSGNIAVSLAYYLPHARLLGVDISAEALRIAGRNAQRHGVVVEFVQSDLFSRVEPEKGFDIICANLPYISEDEYPRLDAQVLRYEPRQALLGFGDGMEVYRRFLPQAWSRLRPGGYLLFEIGGGQGKTALDLLPSSSRAKLLPDGAGRDRLVVVQKEA